MNFPISIVLKCQWTLFLAQGEIFKFADLSDQQSKTQRQSFYDYIWQKRRKKPSSHLRGNQTIEQFW